MLGLFLAVATILSLSAGTAMAKPAPVRQRMQIASSQTDNRGSDEIRSPHAAQPPVWSLEPESINQGTEP